MDIVRVAAALIALVAVPASAQVPPETAAKVREVGKVVDRSLDPYYAPLFGPEAWRGVAIERDLAYGPDPLHKLDVFRPEAAGEKRPVLLFVHGGGFVRGDKHGEFYPDNVTLWAAKHGMVGVNVNYRLAPGTAFPGAAEDLAAAIAWTRANIARYGDDPDRIVLFGHSAGGNHVADYVRNPQLHGPEFAAVKGALLLSPFYLEDPAAGEPHAYYGVRSDSSARAATEQLGASGVPLFYGYAEYDPDNMQGYARHALAELCKIEARCPRSIHLKDHNHLTEGMSLGTPDQSLGGPLLEWIEKVVGGGERG